MNTASLQRSLATLTREIGKASIILVLVLCLMILAMILAILRALPWLLRAAAIAAYIAAASLAFATTTTIYGGGIDALLVSLALIVSIAILPFLPILDDHAKLDSSFGTAAFSALLLLGLRTGLEIAAQRGLTTAIAALPAAGLTLLTLIILTRRNNAIQDPATNSLRGDCQHPDLCDGSAPDGLHRLPLLRHPDQHSP